MGSKERDWSKFEVERMKLNWLADILSGKKKKFKQFASQPKVAEDFDRWVFLGFKIVYFT